MAKTPASPKPLAEIPEVIDARLTALFRATFGAVQPAFFVRAEAPGRLEMAGNHTDHQGGLVISAALDRRIYALAAPNGLTAVRCYAEGFGRIDIDLSAAGALDPHEEERNTTAALIRGVVAATAAGAAPAGFDMVTVSTLPAGAGVSSSAAFEVLVGAVLRGLAYGAGAGAAEAIAAAEVPMEVPLTDEDRMALALDGVRAEREFFGKSCGAQDQITSAFGGAVFMDFAGEMPAASRIDFDPATTGFVPVLIDSRVDHSRYTGDYQSVPADMTVVARALGANRLVEVPQAEFAARAQEVEAALGARAVNRARHYYEETARVAAQHAALDAGNFAAFVQLAGESGISNRETLCNVVPEHPLTGDEDAARPLAIMELCDRLLAGTPGRCRMHGGGFGGCILAFVPEQLAEAFMADMNAVLGYNACTAATLGATGARAWVQPRTTGLDDDRRLYWTGKTCYGKLEVSVNLVKPEKDPRAIAAAAIAAAAAAAAATAAGTTAPACALCGELDRFDAAAELARDPRIKDPLFALDGDTWRIHFSPYGYYPLHCIALAPEHRPMRIDGTCFRRLLACVERFPFYFMGSNADLPIVGGSILAHDHFQGGGHVFPLMLAPVREYVTLQDYPEVEAGIVDWPASTLRLMAADPEALVAAATQVLAAWQTFNDDACEIQAATGDTRHNTITAIAYRDTFAAGADPELEADTPSFYLMDLILRNNRTTPERPFGLFHPAEHLHHIKKENIGLIEAMGLAVLPSRLVREMPGVVYDPAVQEQVTDAFVEILVATGVFKDAPAGAAGWQKLIRRINGED